MSGRSGVELGAALLLAAWLGAVILFGAVVAPSAFAVLQSRTLAGELVGRILPVLFAGGIVAGAAVAAIAAARQGRARAVRIALGVLIVLACGGAHFLVGGRIAAVRAEAGVPIETLPEGHPSRVTFGRLHGLSVAGLAVGALGAMAALVLIAAGPPNPQQRAR
ncbi:MAG TPA: DUF4149 domain-containing protein [Gemmatimonadaceae bacterium]|nr:DUF4149 domain-containing protein [Gemmatimonadaceae bacterium]